MHAASPNRINGWDLFMFDCPYLSKIYHSVNRLFMSCHFDLGAYHCQSHLSTRKCPAWRHHRP
jgi:hypothetical protein